MHELPAWLSWSLGNYPATCHTPTKCQFSFRASLSSVIEASAKRLLARKFYIAFCQVTNQQLGDSVKPGIKFWMFNFVGGCDSGWERQHLRNQSPLSCLIFPLQELYMVIPFPCSGMSHLHAVVCLWPTECLFIQPSKHWILIAWKVVFWMLGCAEPVFLDYVAPSLTLPWDPRDTWESVVGQVLSNWNIRRFCQRTQASCLHPPSVSSDAYFGSMILLFAHNLLLSCSAKGSSSQCFHLGAHLRGLPIWILWKQRKNVLIFLQNFLPHGSISRTLFLISDFCPFLYHYFPLGKKIEDSLWFPLLKKMLCDLGRFLPPLHGCF